MKNLKTLFKLLHHEKINATYSEYQKSYYTDRHEDPSVVQYRMDFIKRDLECEFFEHKFIQMTRDEAVKVIDAHKALGDYDEKRLAPYFYRDPETDAECVEFNVNVSSAFESFVSNHPMGGNLSVRQFRLTKADDDGLRKPILEEDGLKPIIKCGQDEKLYAAFAYPKLSWTIGGTTFLRPKTEGQKEMVSGFVSRVAPMGFPVTQLQLDAINEYRKKEGNNEYPNFEGTDVGAAFMRLQGPNGLCNTSRYKHRIPNVFGCAFKKKIMMPYRCVR